VAVRNGKAEVVATFDDEGVAITLKDVVKMELTRGQPE
jgi:hypothetical protein